MKKERVRSESIRDEKKKDSLIKNIECQYNVDFRVSGDMKLGTYLRKKGLPSLSRAIERVSEKHL